MIYRFSKVLFIELTNFFRKFIFILRNQVIPWIKQNILGIICLVKTTIIYYASLIKGILKIPYEFVKLLFKNKLKTLKWLYLILYSTNLLIFLIFGPYNTNSLFSLILLTLILFGIFSKEIIILIKAIASYIYSFLANILEVILHHKLNAFFYVNWILTYISGILTYICFITGNYSYMFIFLGLCIVFLHLAKLPLVPKFYKDLVETLVSFSLSVSEKILKKFKQLYYMIRYEIFYWLVIIIDVILLLFGFFLIFSGIFDPTGILVEIVVTINIKEVLFPDLNIMFEILFGVSIFTISVILYIILAQNKRKLVRSS